MKRNALLASAVLVLAGCAGGAMSAPRGSGRSYDTHADACAPLAEQSASALTAAGSGRPGTGYVGVALSLPVPASGELENAWGADLTYTQNLAEGVSLELSIGMSRYDIQRLVLSGDLSTLSFGVVCQGVRGFGAARWYVEGGVAYLLNDLSGLGGAEADDSLAIVAGFGAEVPLSSRSSLCLGLRYMLAESELSIPDPLDLSALAIRATYVFLY